MRPLERPQHDPPCFDDEATCRAREERIGFEERLQEAAAAFKARHGHEPPREWAERHRAAFRAWQADYTRFPDLRFGDWLRSYLQNGERAAPAPEELPRMTWGAP